MKIKNGVQEIPNEMLQKVLDRRKQQGEEGVKAQEDSANSINAHEEEQIDVSRAKIIDPAVLLEERAEKLERLREAVANETYSSSSLDVAQKFAEEIDFEVDLGRRPN